MYSHVVGFLVRGALVPPVDAFTVCNHWYVDKGFISQVALIS